MQNSKAKKYPSGNTIMLGLIRAIFGILWNSDGKQINWTIWLTGTIYTSQATSVFETNSPGGLTYLRGSFHHFTNCCIDVLVDLNESLKDVKTWFNTTVI